MATYLDICMILSLLLFTTVVFVSSDKYIQMLDSFAQTVG